MSNIGLTAVLLGTAALALSACERSGLSASDRTTLIRDFGPLPKAPPPEPSNRYADLMPAALHGQKLFFEKRYSPAGISCATCHAPDTGFQDARGNTSEGLPGQYTGRHAPTLINASYGAATPSHVAWNFWDGRSDSQWAQALGPPENPIEMGSSRSAIALLIYDEYRAEYEAIFGLMPLLRDRAGRAAVTASAMPGTSEWHALDTNMQRDITRVFVNFGKSIEAYERKLVSRNSRFDKYYAAIADGADESPLFSEEETRGLKLFLRVCADCHRGPNFTDNEFHNIALEQSGRNVLPTDEGRAGGILPARSSEFSCASEWSDHPRKDQCAVASLRSREEDMGAMKTPGIRNSSQTAPYMHTGAMQTLEEVVEHYSRGGSKSGYVGKRDRAIGNLDLDAAERAALVAFLRTLDGDAIAPSLLREGPSH